MAERPIIFQDSMVRAILEGRKTQTRRLRTTIQKGDMLWVRECHAYFTGPDDREAVAYRTSCADRRLTYAGVDGSVTELTIERWRPSIFMHRWAVRIMLEVTDVRTEPLQDITTEDILAEGVTIPPCPGYDPDPSDGLCLACGGQDHAARKAWRELWDSINGQKPRCAWTDNPDVSVIEFEQAQS